MNNDREQSSVRDLESKISQQEELISCYEAQAAKSQSQMSELQRDNKKLGATSERVQKLQDEFDVMKLELEKQTRKANTADKYMQKLQTTQNIEKERDFFRQELEGARSMVAASDKLRKENLALQKSNDEAGRALSQIEQENEELRMTKKQLRLNYDSLAQQMDALNERFAQDQETIADLRDRSGVFQAPTSPSIVNSGLEGELSESSMLEDQLQAGQILLRWTRILTFGRKMRLADLEKKNQELSSDAADKDAKVLALQRQMGNTQDASTDHYTQLQKTRQENIALQTSLMQVQQGHPIEGSVHPHPKTLQSTHNCASTEVFTRMRDQVKAADARHAKLENEISALRKELGFAHNDRMSSSQNHYLLSNLNIDLFKESLLYKNKLDMAKATKRQNVEEVADLQMECDAARKQNGLLQAELDRQAERNRPSDKDTGNLSREEIFSMLKAVLPGQSLESMSDAIINKIEEGRERMAVKQEVDYLISLSGAAYDSVSLSEREMGNTGAPERPLSIFERISKRFSRANKSAS